MSVSVRGVGQSLTRDVRYALRQLRKSPAFAVTAVLLLALGISAVAAVFTVFDQVMLRAMPVEHPEQLVGLRAGGEWNGHSSTHGGGEDAYFSYPMYRDLSKRTDVFAGLLCSSPGQVGVSGFGDPSAAYVELLSGNAFQVLGLEPALGRLLLPSDTAVNGAGAVAVLSFPYWRDHFGADPRVLGKTVRINGSPFVIVGVTPPQFQGVVLGDTPQLYLPVTMYPTVRPGRNDLERHDSRWLTVSGRLAPGMATGRAQAALQPMWHALRQEEFQRGGNHSERFRKNFVEIPLRLESQAKGFSPQREDLRKPLLLLISLAAMVLLMTCANVATLLLVRAAARGREMAVRYALGAGKRRIFGQLLVEGLLLGASGCVLGMAAAPALTASLLNMLFPGGDGTAAFAPGLNGHVLLMAVLIAGAVTLLFSITPMLEFWRPDVMRALKQQAATQSGGSARLRSGLVIAQIGISVVLLVAAGLFVRTLSNLQEASLGFTTAHVLTFSVDPKLSGYSLERGRSLYQELLLNLQSLPGVQAVGATNAPLLAGDSQGGNITVAGYKNASDEDMDIEQDAITPGYFAALHIPLVAGRMLTEGDTATSQHVAVVNERFAKHFFGSAAAALGRQYGEGAGQHAIVDTTIVGVVADTKHENVRDDVLLTAFQPATQVKDPGRMQFYLRTWQAPEAATAEVRAAVNKVDPALVLSHFGTLDAQRANSVNYERMMAILATLFGAAAAGISAIGLYGVTAFTVGQRTREFGVRVAVGASRQQIVRLVLRGVMRLVGIGIVLALPFALLAARALHGTLYGVGPVDPWTLAAVPLAMASVAVLAAGMPARRAARVDPMQALREE